LLELLWQFCRSTGVVKFGLPGAHEEQVRAFADALGLELLDRLADLALVPVARRAVDEAVARRHGRLDRRLHLAGLGRLERPEADRRHPRAVVQDDVADAARGPLQPAPRHVGGDRRRARRQRQRRAPLLEYPHRTRH